MQIIYFSWINRTYFSGLPDPASASKNLSFILQKIVSKLLEIWSGMFITDSDSESGSRIRILIFFIHPGSLIQGTKRHGSLIWICLCLLTNPGQTYPHSRRQSFFICCPAGGGKKGGEPIHPSNGSSVPDPWHFCTNPDPRVCTSA